MEGEGRLCVCMCAINMTCVYICGVNEKYYVNKSICCCVLWIDLEMCLDNIYQQNYEMFILNDNKLNK